MQLRTSHLSWKDINNTCLVQLIHITTQFASGRDHSLIISSVSKQRFVVDAWLESWGPPSLSSYFSRSLGVLFSQRVSWNCNLHLFIPRLSFFLLKWGNEGIRKKKWELISLLRALLLRKIILPLWVKQACQCSPLYERKFNFNNIACNPSYFCSFMHSSRAYLHAEPKNFNPHESHDRSV